MTLLFALTVATLFGSGVYLLLQGRTFPVALGLIFLSYGVNLFLFSSGPLITGLPPLIHDGSESADPLPQALILTAIVIGFATTALLLVLALRTRADQGNDKVNEQSSAEDTE